MVYKCRNSLSRVCNVCKLCHLALVHETYRLGNNIGSSHFMILINKFEWNNSRMKLHVSIPKINIYPKRVIINGNNHSVRNLISTEHWDWDNPDWKGMVLYICLDILPRQSKLILVVIATPWRVISSVH